MKVSLGALLIFILLMLPSSAFSEGQQAEGSCVDEICDGLDNDCDKSIDDFVDCGLNLECGCANCNKAMVGGACAEGVPWQGFCLVDRCPPGTKCNFQTGKCRRQ